MAGEIQAAAKRASRVTIGIIIAQAIVHFTGNPLYLGLAPIINAVGKFVRNKWNLNFIPV